MERTTHRLRISNKNGEQLDMIYLLDVLQIKLGELVEEITGWKEEGGYSTYATITAKAGEEVISEILNVLSKEGYNATRVDFGQ